MRGRGRDQDVGAVLHVAREAAQSSEKADVEELYKGNIADIATVHYDRNVADQCRFDDAEYVKEKERPNFCDYFNPSETAHDTGDGVAGAARQQLDQLFGDGGSEAAPDAPSELESLFKKPDC